MCECARLRLRTSSPNCSVLNCGIFQTMVMFNWTWTMSCGSHLHIRAATRLRNIFASNAVCIWIDTINLTNCHSRSSGQCLTRPGECTRERTSFVNAIAWRSSVRVSILQHIHFICGHGSPTETDDLIIAQAIAVRPKPRAPAYSPSTIHNKFE